MYIELYAGTVRVFVAHALPLVVMIFPEDTGIAPIPSPGCQKESLGQLTVSDTMIIGGIAAIKLDNIKLTLSYRCTFIKPTATGRKSRQTRHP